MSKVLLISGSNRTGNTEYILKRINKEIDSSLILLKNKRIEYCKGCLSCHHSNRCIIKDDANEIMEDLIKSDLIIFGIPNYFDNVLGLFKNFIDRMHPLYKSGKINGKKVIFIYVGGGKETGTLEQLHQSIKGFSKYLGFDIKEEFSLKSLNPNDIKKQEEKIDEMISNIKLYL